MSDKEILEQFGLQLIEDIKANAISQNRVASHKAEQGLRQEVTDSQLQVIDSAGYIEWGWERGRGPGKMPPVDSIVQWIADKGLAIPEKKRRGVAYAIALSIKNRGTVLHQQGGNSGVVSDEITGERFEALKATFGTKYLNDIKSQIVNVFKQ